MKPIVSILAIVLLLASSTSFAAPPEEVTVLYTGGIRGQLYAITTCGETMESYGGLPRLSTMIEAMKPLFVNPIVLLDGGNFVPDSRQDVEFKADVTMSGLKAMGYDAVGIGTSDLRFNADKLKSIYNTHAMPMLASNLVEKETGAHYGKPYVLVKSGNLSLAVLCIIPEDGLTQYNSTSARKTLDVLSPTSAVSDILKELEGKADITILFADLNMADTRALVSGLPDLDIAISNEIVTDGEGLDPGHTHPYVLPMGLGNMSLGRLTLQVNEDGGITVVESELTALDDVVPSDETMNALIYEAHQAKFKQEKKERKLQEVVKFGEQSEEIQELQKLSPMEYLNRITQQNDE